MQKKVSSQETYAISVVTHGLQLHYCQSCSYRKLNNTFLTDHNPEFHNAEIFHKIANARNQSKKALISVSDVYNEM